MGKKYTATRMIIDPNHVNSDGIAYKIPYGIEADKFYSIVEEFVDLAKVKGLTIRQAQTLFSVCSEYILDRKFD